MVDIKHCKKSFKINYSDQIVKEKKTEKTPDY